jgi:hypothetical protein
MAGAVKKVGVISLSFLPRDEWRRTGILKTFVCGICSAAFAAGCGSSGGPVQHGPLQGKPPPGILGRVLTSNEMRGFTGQTNGIDNGAYSWVADLSIAPSRRRSQATTLARRGFIRGVLEHLQSTGGDWALSLVMQFRSTYGAQLNLAAEDASFRAAERHAGQRYIRFPVTEIPGAVGGGIVSLADGQIFVRFVQGPYYYIVARDLPVTATGPIRATVATVIAAADHLYKRVSAPTTAD